MSPRIYVQGGPEMPVRVLYVGGVARSGSTVLGRALAATPGVASVGEVVHIWSRGLLGDERCGCGQPFSACPFWTRVGERAFGGWDVVDGQAVEALRLDVDRTRFMPWLLSRTGPVGYCSALKEYSSVLARLYTAIREESGARVIVDTSKHASSAGVLALTAGIDLRVLHLVRDVRGVAFSWSKTVMRPEVQGGVAYMHGDTPAKLARHWLFTNACFDVAGSRGTRTLRIRYEDFVSRPGTAMTSMLSFVGLRDDARVSGALATSGVTIPVQHEVAGNPMRFGGERLRLRSDDEWRQGLPPRDRALVSVVGRPLMLRYRY